MPSLEELEGFYPHGYWWEEKAGSASSLGTVVNRLEKGYRDLVIQDHVRFLIQCAGEEWPRGKSLLDIGCGSGTFLYHASRRGFIPYGLDASSEAVELARVQYGLQVRQGAVGSEVWEYHRFDFVTMFHVLEHLPDPREALLFAAGLLKPQGSLIVQVPNVASCQARMFGSRWYGLDVPRHLVNFTAGGLEILLNQVGFEIVKVSHFSLRDNPASLASSIAPELDPVGRRGSGRQESPAGQLCRDALYFGLALLAVPFVALESALGYGGTVMVHARRRA
jgi:2-polyprenyl-3-methyl-5-hydroxy-6-metoxy-1,4-benzoquinol methylase